MAQVNEGTPDTWDWGTAWSSSDANTILQKMAPYLKIIKNCKNTSTDCFYNGKYKTLNTTRDWGYINPNVGDFARAVLADGSAIYLFTFGGQCTTVRGTSKALKSACGWVGIDLNGTKPPNRLGVDTFNFRLTKYGIVPYGVKDDTQFCIKSSGCTYKSNCLSSSNVDNENGYACTAWVIQKGNMDYLKRDIRDEW